MLNRQVIIQECHIMTKRRWIKTYLSLPTVCRGYQFARRGHHSGPVGCSPPDRRRKESISGADSQTENPKWSFINDAQTKRIWWWWWWWLDHHSRSWWHGVMSAVLNLPYFVERKHDWENTQMSSLSPVGVSTEQMYESPYHQQKSQAIFSHTLFFHKIHMGAAREWLDKWYKAHEEKNKKINTQVNQISRINILNKY